LRTEAVNHFLASSRLISFAFNVAKSVAGLEGSLFGHATSPIFLALPGGMETVISAKDGTLARSPVNISPFTVERLRVVVTSMLTLVAFGALSATGTRTFLAWPPHPASTAITVHATSHSTRQGTRPSRSSFVSALFTRSPALAARTFRRHFRHQENLCE